MKQLAFLRGPILTVAMPFPACLKYRHICALEEQNIDTDLNSARTPRAKGTSEINFAIPYNI